MLSVIQNLALDIATFSNRDLEALARELIRVFPTRAERLEHAISVETQEFINDVYRELGIEA